MASSEGATGMKTYSTGAIREDKTLKGSYSLIPYIGMQRLALHFEKGGAKHGDRNWEKGLPLSTYINAMLRHAFKLSAGYTDEDHAAALAWNAMCFMHTQVMLDEGKLPPELNDLVDHTIADKLLKKYAELPL